MPHTFHSVYMVNYMYCILIKITSGISSDDGCNFLLLLLLIRRTTAVIIVIDGKHVGNVRILILNWGQMTVHIQ